MPPASTGLSVERRRQPQCLLIFLNLGDPDLRELEERSTIGLSASRHEQLQREGSARYNSFFPAERTRKRIVRYTYDVNFRNGCFLAVFLAACCQGEQQLARVACKLQPELSFRSRRVPTFRRLALWPWRPGDSLLKRSSPVSLLLGSNCLDVFKRKR